MVSETPSHLVPAAQIANRLSELAAAHVQPGMVAAMEANQRRPEVPIMKLHWTDALQGLPCIMAAVTFVRPASGRIGVSCICRSLQPAAAAA